ncbi:ATP-grasp domain-containing protein [Salinisphaera sp. SPP-AMP-43]|uniref:ATP-grasp domain-containing protein n=1 Tax=Salinisphaera sp. SPP-AMP-43 TaxID=3121288 RepID=UPI003C6E9F90
MTRRNVFVLGLDDFNRRKLERLPIAEECRFIGLIDPSEIMETEYFPIDDLLERANARLEAFEGPVDALIGYVDFPVSTMLPILARGFGLRGPSLEALLKCEHKYWSRCEQRAVVATHIPRFELVDPFATDVVGELTLDYPFWLKPVKSAGSYLGFHIDSDEALRTALTEIRANIGIFAEPFDRILEHAELPAEIAAVGGHYCLAESLIGGRQCTLEGYVIDGEIHFHGLIDSIRAKGRPTFLRYQYPSRLPHRARAMMEDIARRVLAHIGFDQSAFNIEFFWDADADNVWLLEINTRIAQHHSDLFEKVDGVSNHEAAVNVALGRKPQFPDGKGRFAYAACCFLRAYDDAVVGRLPSDAELKVLAAEIPGMIFEPHVHPGMRLSELTHQETYSYALALVYIGGDGPEQLRTRYRLCRNRLDFDLKPIT